MIEAGGPTTADVDQVEAICGKRQRFRSVVSARHRAEALEREQDAAGWAVYPCPFAPESAPHWHIDPWSSPTSLEEIARAMRGLPPAAPEPHDPPPRTRRRRTRKEPRT